MYEYVVTHDGLGKRQVVRARTEWEAREKADAKVAAWNAQYARALARDERQSARDEARYEREALKEEADERTAEAERAIADLTSILSSVVKASPVLRLEQRRITADFGEARPILKAAFEHPRPPMRGDWSDAPKYSFLDRLFTGLRVRKEKALKEANDAAFSSDNEKWIEKCRRVDRANAEASTAHELAVSIWARKKEKWEKDRDKGNEILDQLLTGLRTSETTAVTALFDEIWNLIPLPEDLLSGEYQLDFDEAAKTLVVDLDLPELERMPNVKQFKYVASRKEIEEISLKETVVRSLYDQFVYQLLLAIPHAFFSCDTEKSVEAMVVNGWVTYINGATGNKTTACVASLHCEANELLKINLSAVDPRLCFRSLKGVASPQINSLSPVRPIICVDRSDKRFVNSQKVIDSVEAGANLATLGWEDFEHLIRELFEKEFSAGGGEVKVTQASRDGGVDAVAFDPDPIRGGKIVIQAKRYTNTVDVAAVRDLYGTVHSEGATKGIIVTTSSFGPDAHRFAKGKPLTLLDGNNLLYLLAKHGTVARIDLAEAKKVGNSLMRSSARA